MIRNNLFRNFYLVYSLLLIFSFNSFAQNKGNISGRILDATDNSPLWGANIFIKNTAIGTASNDEGKFRINQVPSGNVTLVIKYVGYITVEETVNVIEGKTVEIQIALKPAVIEGKEVIVTGQLQGQQAAINQQLTSNTIVNVVSRDKIQELPDQNAAETLARLPGISLQRNAGEGQKVIVRGLSAKYNNITINNVKIPSTDEQDRSVDLSSISPDMLAGIEVYKSLTADKDADAIGGTINFVVKKAPDKFITDVKLQGGYGSHEKFYGPYRGSISVSDRFFNNTLGAVFTANIQRADRSSDAQDVSYNFGSEKVGTETRAKIKVENLNLIDRKEIRDRYGLSLVLDYDLDNGNIFFSTFWSKTERDEIRRRKRYRLGVARVEYDFLKRDIDLQIITSNLEGKHNFGIFQVDWLASFSESNQQTPFEFFNRFQELSPFTNQLIDDQGPELIPFGAKNNISETTFKESSITTRNVIDKNLTAQFNTRIDFDLGNDIAGFLKFGAKYRLKTRNRDNTQYWTSNFNIDSLGRFIYVSPEKFYRTFALSGGRNILMSNFLSPKDEVGKFLEGKYAFGPTLDKGMLMDWLNNLRYAKLRSGKDLYILNNEINLEDYEANESIFAAYVMSELKITPKLIFLPGVRMERTYNDYKSIFGTPKSGEDETPDLVNVKDTTGSKTYYEFLPMIQLKYNVTDWFDVRAAITKTLARPDYFNLVPWERVSYLDITIEKGNPYLKHTKVWNYDLFFSIYNQYGLFTIGGFYKKLWDIDYIRKTRIQDGGKYNGFMLTQAVNAESASIVYGIEIELQANMTLLPSPFDGIVFYANLSLMKSKTYFPYFAIGPRSPLPPYAPTIIDTVRSGPMPGQADKLGNIAIGYEKGGFSGRLSLSFQGKNLSFVGPREELDGYMNEFWRWDLAIQQKIFEGFSIFLNVNNISNVADRSYLGIQSFPTREEFFGWTADIGIKYKL